MRALLACVLAIWAGQAVAGDRCRDDAVTLRGDWGELRFAVEIADTPRERSRGLMHRQELSRNAGMLFVYDTAGAVSFWMKNTLIPLDMIFAGPDGTVLRVHHDAIPGDLTSIDGGDGVLAVLEINGGLARRYGIGAGDQMRHPVFAAGPAAWPC
ncbi:DUF192 domain-containing protein [Pukyongiella litopenaei]|uniref:DUF192 domain-containing protein n=1 Tax=Pukyongiella litopenaei TaxID=2605946 RepID=A0A2S0MTQ9_9RHOB|nr:DUF192 domain-containing protein [Pukyongiella litopenaei]AVO39265.1 DUF192 domain-containing protein [Pukyongiella litopenaei]